MATIQTYIRDTNITNDDLLMGTSYISLNKYETRKFKIGDLTDYIVQQVNIDPTNLSLKSNGGVVRESDADGNSILAVDLGASNITGQLANSDLANSSITINGAAISLGGSVTTPDTNTQLSTEQVQDIVGAMFSGNTETRISATYVDGDGTIDLVVDDMTANDVRTVTAGGNTLASNETLAFTAGSNVSISEAAGAVTIASTDTNTQLTDAQVRSKISVTGGGASYNSSTGVITLPSQFTLATGNVTNASVSGQTLTLTRQSVSDITFTPTANDFTNTLKTKLDGIATGAEVNVQSNWNESSNSNDAFIQNKPTIPSGNQIIDWTQSGAGTIHASNYVDNDTTYTLPAGSSSDLGGIKIGYVQNAKNYPVQLDSDKAYANVPWTDTVYTLPVASSSLGGVKLGYTDNGKNYALELDGDNEAFVNVPWTDTVYTLPTAASNTLGGVKVGSNLTIDGNGVLNVGAIALTTVQAAANQTAHLALTAQEGDIVVRSDENKSYVHNGGTAGSMADYTALLTPTDAVLSVTTTDGSYINLTPNSATTGAINVAADLSAVDGTLDATGRFLTKGNKWAVPAYTTETYTQHENISAASSVDNSGRTYIQDITLDSNGHVTAITSATETVTDTNTQLSDSQVRGKISGTGLISYDNSTGVISTSANNYSLPAAADGTRGGVQIGYTESGKNYPVELDSEKMFVNVPWTDTNTDTNTQRSDEDIRDVVAAMLTAGTNIGLSEDDSANTLTVTATDTNTQRSDEDIRDVTVAMLTAGTNIALTEDDAANTLTIAATDTNTQLTTAQVRAKFTAGTNVSITNGEISATDTNTDTNTQNTYSISIPSSTTKFRLTGAGHDGATTDDIEFVGSGATTVTRTNANKFTISSTDTNTDTNTFRTVTAGGNTLGATETLAFTEGSNVSISESGGAVTIASTDTNTTYSTATSSALGLVKIGYSENGKNYPVELSAGKMFVNVPWTDTNTNVTNHITNNANDTATGVYSFTNTGDHRFGAGGNGNIYVGNVISASAADKGFRIHSNNADVYFDYRTDSTGSHFYRQYDGSGGIHTRFEHDITSGIFRASSDIVAYFSFSDKRLKENIKPTNYGLNELLKLNPVEFKWKEKEGKEIGLIAQEVEEIVPEVIKENKRINDDTLYKQVDYEKLVPVLINSIKELNERIKQLEDGDTN